MTKPVHSPLPWKVEEVGVSSLGPDGEAVCEVFTADGYQRVAESLSAGDAALIVRAVNSHAELVEAAHNAVGVLMACCVPAGGVDDRAAIWDAENLLRSALSRATEGDTNA